jgi:ribonuclease HI
MYQFPEELGILRTWLAAHGHDVNSIVSERQAAFHAQMLAGTYHKFPSKGQSCRSFLLQIQATVVKRSQDRRSEPKQAVPRRGRSSEASLALVPSARSTNADHVFYTDGCCSPNPGAGGWAYVDYHEAYETWIAYGGERTTTNNRMELTALVNCLEWIWIPFRDEPTIVHTDSQYALKVATVWGKAWAARGWKRKGGQIENIDLVKRTHKLMQDLPQVSVEWVRGHAGETGNERADELAEQGRLLAMSANDNEGVAA